MNKIFLALALVLYCGCTKPATNSPVTSTANNSVPVQEKEYYDPDFKPLPDKSSWVLDRLNGQELAVAEMTGEIPTLELDLIEGKARGNAGCNRYNSSVKLEGTAIYFGQIMSTKVSCQAQALENRYLAILRFGLLSYQYTPEKLIIRRDVRSVLEFKRQN